MDQYHFILLQADCLTFGTLDKIFSRSHIEIFFKKTGFDSGDELETICMTCQILFSGKNKKNITNLSSAELAKRVVKVKFRVKFSL